MARPLAELCRLLGEIAPLEHAETWDNAGLLLEPTCDRCDTSRPPEVRRALLTIDLTRAVLEEAVERDVDLIVAYHPPIFQPLARLTLRSPRERLLLEAVERKIAIYSPHTALDAAPGGVNDWLADALGPGARAPLVAASSSDDELKLVIFVPEAALDTVRGALSAAGAGVIGLYRDCSFELRGNGTFFGGEGTSPEVGERGKLERVPEVRLEMICPRRALARAAAAVARAHPYEEPAWDVYPLAGKPEPGRGAGRSVELSEPASLPALVERIKRQIGRPVLRVATAERHREGASIERVALCAGSGGALFEASGAHDLFVTGELRHHDVLAKLAAGSSVVLCEHSSSERGYLPVLAERLKSLAGDTEFGVAAADREPLELL